MTKPTKWLCAQRRLRSAWASVHSDQSVLCAQWVTKDPSFLHVDSEDSDQTGRMPRLIWVFTGRTSILLVLSWGGSYGMTLVRRDPASPCLLLCTIAVDSAAKAELEHNIFTNASLQHENYSVLSNRPSAARIGANVTRLDELQNANPRLNLFSKSWN